MNNIDIGRLSTNSLVNRPRIESKDSGTKNTSNFDEILRKKTGPNSIKFSKHAEDRIRSRNINFTDSELLDIEDALRSAGKKGINDTLILTDKAALIASAKNNTIITTVPREQFKQNVFTNIDGAVIV